MECNFVVGQKVVCVEVGRLPCHKAQVNYLNNDLDGLTKNEIYTIREVLFDDAHKVPVVRLMEITRPPLYLWCDIEAYYAAERFRPLRDLTVFHEILAKANLPTRKLIDA